MHPVKNNTNIGHILHGTVFPAVLFFLFGLLVGRSWTVIANKTETENNFASPAARKMPMIPFPEEPWATDQTVKRTVIASTPFARFELHDIIPDLRKPDEIVEGWMWADERAHVNVAVQMKADGKFALFKQRKYGLREPKIATVGGFLEEGESPADAARREVAEEMGLVCDEVVALGARNDGDNGVRVQVNRGGGILYPFFARGCEPISSKPSAATTKTVSFSSSSLSSSSSSLRSVVGQGDYEAQTQVLLTADELRDALMGGEVGEAQWGATVAMALLHLQTDV